MRHPDIQAYPQAYQASGLALEFALADRENAIELYIIGAKQKHRINGHHLEVHMRCDARIFDADILCTA